MYKKMERYVLEVIKGQRKGFFANCVCACLRVASWFFQAGVTVRNWAYDRNILSKHFPPVPVVVSIGNIVVGGAGKTPVTMLLAKAFEQDTSIAILTRGYRSAVEKASVPIELSKGEGPIYPATYCGDEPYLLSRNLPKAMIYVGRDRTKASKMAARAGAELLLLDDGMQHRRLARDLEVIVMDATDPFGQGYFLPRGFLREDLSSLRRADLIILNRIKDEAHFLSRKAEIEKYTAAPFIGTQLKIQGIFDLHDNWIAAIRNQRVAIFSGIANPDFFAETVQSLGAKVMARTDLPDHLGFEYEGISNYAESCQRMGAEMLVCTEKDKVKIDPSWKLPLPIAWIKISLSILYGEEHWNHFIQRIRDELFYRK